MMASASSGSSCSQTWFFASSSLDPTDEFLPLPKLLISDLAVEIALAQLRADSNGHGLRPPSVDDVKRLDERALRSGK
jgi:hypothetical protein